MGISLMRGPKRSSKSPRARSSRLEEVHLERDEQHAIGAQQCRGQHGRDVRAAHT